MAKHKTNKKEVKKNPQFEKVLIKLELDPDLLPVLQYAQILEWHYTHDGVFNDKNEWRDEFTKMLKRVLKISK